MSADDDRGDRERANPIMVGFRSIEASVDAGLMRTAAVRCSSVLNQSPTMILHAGLADGTYARRLRGWARPALLIIDNVGLGHVKPRAEEPFPGPGRPIAADDNVVPGRPAS